LISGGLETVIDYYLLMFLLFLESPDFSGKNYLKVS